MAGKSVILLSILCCYIASVNISWAKEHIHLDIEPFLKNEKIFSKLMDCILDEGPCPRQMADFKQQISSLVDTDCVECQEQFKQLSAKALIYIRDNKPDKLKLIQEKYKITDEDIEEALKEFQ